MKASAFEDSDHDRTSVGHFPSNHENNVSESIFQKTVQNANGDAQKSPKVRHRSIWHPREQKSSENRHPISDCWHE
jgi:hypothetical protein